MTTKELSIKEYAKNHGIDPPFNSQHLYSHNFFFRNPDGYWVENINRRRLDFRDGWYVKEDDFFKELKNINRKLKLENLAQKI